MNSAIFFFYKVVAREYIPFNYLMLFHLVTKQVNFQAKIEISQQIERDELRQVCCDSLVLLSSAAPQVAHLLRPMLLQCLLQSEFSPITGLLARCTNCIVARSSQEESSMQPECADLQMPRVLDVLARCLVLLGSPLPENGVHILNLLKSVISPDLEGHAVQVLEHHVPKLVDLIQGMFINFSYLLLIHICCLFILACIITLKLFT
jgi:hypothetical protein